VDRARIKDQFGALKSAMFGTRRAPSSPTITIGHVKADLAGAERVVTKWSGIRYA
jgi:hypothetical protein